MFDAVRVWGQRFALVGRWDDPPEGWREELVGGRAKEIAEAIAGEPEGGRTLRSVDAVGLGARDLAERLALALEAEDVRLFRPPEPPRLSLAQVQERPGD